MKKQVIKIIRRTDGEEKPQSPGKTPEKKRSIEGTIQNWISERRENADTETRSRNSKFASLTTDFYPAKAS